jgi:hypothetical protein
MAMSSSFRFRADNGGCQARGTRGACEVGRPVVNQCLRQYNQARLKQNRLQPGCSQLQA